MTIHLYLGQNPVLTGIPMVTATSPAAAISLLRSGVVTRLSVAENWSSTCDPENQVAAFFKQATHAKEIPLPEWKEEKFMDLMFSPEVINAKLAERLRQSHDYCVAHHPELSLGWTFDSFSPVSGSETAYAYATLASMDSHPGRNPLLIFGPEKSGKSHLLNALGLQWLHFNKDSGNLLFLTAENLMANDSAAEKIVALTGKDILLVDGLEKLTTPALASFVPLIDELIFRGTGMVFTWCGTRNEVAKVASSFFYNHLCVVELAKRNN